MIKHRVIIALGSNIEPEKHIQEALHELGKVVHIRKRSSFSYTKPLLFENQPDFLNGVTLVETTLDKNSLKQHLLDIENELGRKRTSNKYGPRIIDLDIIIFDGKVVDHDYYERDFLQKFVEEVS
ncbi:MAG TPA: 2-amino-4-hydroxy-6-hydroxymethyldihydropteridine diphosphokinase [Balneolales bacterium]|nr:2-amino-4-hydroxy-6-hydroxymethyldihydropteridine diphosphokinase [Balneolales bacterium]